MTSNLLQAGKNNSTLAIFTDDNYNKWKHVIIQLLKRKKLHWTIERTPLEQTNYLYNCWYRCKQNTHSVEIKMLENKLEYEEASEEPTKDKHERFEVDH